MSAATAKPLPGLGIRPELREAPARNPDVRLLLVRSPAGSGKTTLLREWQASAHDPACWLDLDEPHADLAIFAEDLTRALRDAGLDEDSPMGLDLLRALPHLERLTAPAVWRFLRPDLVGLPAPLVVFLDNYHRLGRGSAADQLVSAMLRDDACPLRFAIATRGAPPQAAARLLAEGQATLLDRDALALDADQVGALLDQFGVDADDPTVRQLWSVTGGWVTGVLLAARGLERVEPERREPFLEALGRRADLFEYVAGELLAGEDAASVEVAELAAVLGPCDRDTLIEALPPGTQGTAVQRAIDRGLLLEERERVLVHQLWEELLLRMLRERSSADTWRALHERLATCIESLDARRAVVILARGEAWASLVTVLARHGREWLNLGHDEFVMRQLGHLPPDLRREHAEIEYLEALSLRRRDVDLALDALMRVAERFRREGSREQEVGALFDAQILAANRNRRGLMARIARRVLSLRRLATDPRVRAISLVGLAFAALLSGRTRVADSILRRIHTRALLASERASVPLLRLQLMRHRGRWTESLELIESGLSDHEIREHAPSVLLFELERACIEGHRASDPGEAIGLARRVRDDLAAFGLTVNEAMALEVVGLLESRRGRHDAARADFSRAGELAESIGRTDFSARMRALIARERWCEGQPEAARLDARHALALYGQVSARELRTSLYVDGAVLPARVLAECGEIEAALKESAALATSGERRDLPLAAFASCVLHARIAELAEDAGARDLQLRRAAALAEAADLSDAPPDLEPALLGWAAGAAARSGIGWRQLGTRAAAPPAGWTVGSLGGLRVAYSGVPIPEKAWRGGMTRRLLLRLLCAGPGGMRRELAESELWPDHDAGRARANLRVALSRLRTALSPHDKRAIRIEDDRIDVSPELRAGWDVDRLEGALRDGCVNADLLALYRGSFAPEVYEEWADPVRRRIEDNVSRASEVVIDELLSQGDRAGALALVETLVGLRPADEASWSRLVELRLAAGDRIGARRALAEAKATLERELGVPADVVLEDLTTRVG